MADILFFLIITIYFIFKLKNNFGKKAENDKKREKIIEEFLKQRLPENIIKKNSNDEKVINLFDIPKKEDSINLNVDFEVPDNVKKKLVEIDFNQDIFLKGVESVVEMVNESFSNKDLETLRRLMAKKVFVNFEKQINDLSSQNKNLKSSLVSILSKEIKSISYSNNYIMTEVIVKSEQINFVEDKNKNVILGDKKRIDVVTEKWIFARSVKSKINFWIIDSIINIE